VISRVVPTRLLSSLPLKRQRRADLKSTLAFHRLSEEQRHQYDGAFAELEVLIQEISIPRTQSG